MFGGGDGHCTIHGSQTYAPRVPTEEDAKHRNDKYIQKEFEFTEAPLEDDDEGMED